MFSEPPLGGTVFPPGVSALVFDLDGTLYRNAPLERSIHQVAVGYLAGVTGRPLGEAAELLAVTRRRLATAAGQESTLSAACVALGGDIRELHRQFAAEIEPEAFLQPDLRLRQLLLGLGERHALYLYTNNNRPLAERILDCLGVGDCFRRLFSIEERWIPKPDAGMLAWLYGEIGQPPAACLFVGDRYDIDLRLPAAAGSPVFTASGTEQLLCLADLITRE